MEKALEPLVYGRIILVGWGTVIGSILMFALIDSIVRQHSLPRYLTLDFALGILHCIWIGTAISIFLLIPMLIIWMPIYAVIHRFVISIKKASTLAAAASAVVGMMLVGLYIGQGTGKAVGVVTTILPWSLVPMCIAASLTWFAFRSEQFAGGK